MFDATVMGMGMTPLVSVAILDHRVYSSYLSLCCHLAHGAVLVFVSRVLLSESCL